MSNFKPTYLYIKQHSITGKLYFGKTIKNPEKYNGSGKYWMRHIKKHGKEYVTTLWYCLFYDKEGGEGIMQRWHFNNCKYQSVPPV